MLPGIIFWTDFIVVICWTSSRNQPLTLVIIVSLFATPLGGALLVLFMGKRLSREAFER